MKLDKDILKNQDKETQKVSYEFYKPYIEKYVRITYMEGERPYFIRGRVLDVNNLHLKMEEIGQAIPSSILLTKIISIRGDKDQISQRRLDLDGNNKKPMD